MAAQQCAHAKVRELVRTVILEGVRTSIGQLSTVGGMRIEVAYRRAR